MPETGASVHIRGSDVIALPATHVARGREPGKKTRWEEVSRLRADIAAALEDLVLKRQVSHSVLVCDSLQ